MNPPTIAVVFHSVCANTYLMAKEYREALLLNELAYQEVDIPPIVRFADMGGLLSRVLEDFLDQFSIDRARLLGVGIALPAVMSPDSRFITAAPTLRLKDTSLEGLASSIPYPTYVENDATSGGHAELFVREGNRNMAYLSLENGVGGAILFGGAPYVGDNPPWRTTSTSPPSRSPTTRAACGGCSPPGTSPALTWRPSTRRTSGPCPCSTFSASWRASCWGRRRRW